MSRAIAQREFGVVAQRVFHVVGQPLGALADGAVVDGVGSNGVHLAPPPARAERNNGPEGVVELLPLFCGNMLGHLVGIVGVLGFGEPGANIRRSGWRDFVRLGGSFDRGNEFFGRHGERSL